ncbi:hypothetical protein CS542_09190 [Pedobacter sp. IW39]|nr:hypothetical protein CS542_09190 [Pedobacter sp. IW39]
MIYKSVQRPCVGIKELTDAPFNLADHMLRAYLIVLGADEYVLLVTMHIASDGWSTGMSIRTDQFITPVQKKRFTYLCSEIQLIMRYGRQGSFSQVEKFHLDYWKKLNGGDLVLPADYPRPAVSSKGAVR